MDFGDTKKKITSVIPNENETEKITSFRKIQIKAIHLQTTKITIFGTEQEMICGLLLEYTDRMPMRWLATEGHVSERKLTRIELDPSRRIHTIKVLIGNYGKGKVLHD